MTPPAARNHQSPLETVLLDVHTALADLLVASDEQYAAVVARDLERLESITCQQEGLAARLEQAEAKRVELLSGESLLSAAAASEPVKQLSDSIAASVV